MDILEVVQGLKQGKKYQLPGWERMYIFLKDNTIYIQFGCAGEQIYNLHLSEIESKQWHEFVKEG